MNEARCVEIGKMISSCPDDMMILLGHKRAKFDEFRATNFVRYKLITN